MTFDTLTIRTRTRSCFLDVTAEIQKVVAASGVSNGLCVCFVPHTTAGVTINENADPSVQSDIQNVLAKLIPEGAGYAHAEGNSDSHVKASLVGSSVTLTVQDGELILGTWQGIYFCEFDGPRSRRLNVTVIGASV